MGCTRNQASERQGRAGASRVGMHHSSTRAGGDWLAASGAAVNGPVAGSTLLACGLPCPRAMRRRLRLPESARVMRARLSLQTVVVMAGLVDAWTPGSIDSRLHGPTASSTTSSATSAALPRPPSLLSIRPMSGSSLRGPAHIQPNATDGRAHSPSLLLAGPP